MAGEKVIRRAIEAARKAVAPEDLLMGIHNTAEGRRLDMIERLGGLPAPSIAITKPSQGYTSFGDISLVAPVEMVTPGRKTPVFGSDVYSPRFPDVEDDQIFRGFTPAGYRRYAPLTMENVLREMKGNIRGGESFNYGPASIRAQVTPQFGSLLEMQAAREKIIPSSEFGAQKDMSTEMMERLRERFEPYFKPTDPYRRSWSAFPEVLTDYARTGRPSEFAYDYKDLPAEALTDARSFLSHLRDMPTEYFEAKPQRAVPLSEFSGAVVPADVPGSVVDRIRNMGINRIEEYGDDASRAEALMKFVGEQGFADGGEVRDDFDKGGLARRAIDAARRVMGYTDPPTKKIEDWQWRPLSEVDKELGLREIPPHVQNFGDYMREMVDRARAGEITDRDLIKAYTTTRASIQRRSADTDKIREASGLPLEGAGDKIRPEGAWAEWLMSPAGQKYLDKAVKGEMNEDTVESALSVMRRFGLAPTQVEAMDWAAKNLPGRSQAASDLVYRAGQQDSPVSEWRNFTSDVRGVGPAKSGFLASMLGRGDLPTLDARQIILNTGRPTEASQSIMDRSYQRQKSFGAQEGVDRLAARQEALGLEAPSRYDPFYQHLAHHTIWDKASNETTTHADIINAMRNAAIVLGTPAAGAALMSDEAEARGRASGGRLLEDQYPTHYLPNVGRQVMADGGGAMDPPLTTPDQRLDVIDNYLEDAVDQSLNRGPAMQFNRLPAPSEPHTTPNERIGTLLTYGGDVSDQSRYRNAVPAPQPTVDPNRQSYLEAFGPPQTGAGLTPNAPAELPPGEYGRQKLDRIMTGIFGPNARERAISAAHNLFAPPSPYLSPGEYGRHRLDAIINNLLDPALLGSKATLGVEDIRGGVVLPDRAGVPLTPRDYGAAPSAQPIQGTMAPPAPEPAAKATEIRSPYGQFNDADVEALANMIAGEASTQGRESMAQVGQVALNRALMNYNDYGNTLQAQLSRPRQFLGYNSPNAKAIMAGETPQQQAIAQQAREIARGLIEGTIQPKFANATDFNRGSTSFNAKRGAANAARLGSHTFFNASPAYAKRLERAKREREGRATGGIVDDALGVVRELPQEDRVRVAMFAGEGAVGAPLQSLELAKRLIAEGASPEEAYRGSASDGATGWFQGADGRWRFEVSDKDAIINPENFERLRAGNSVRPSELLSHPRLFEMYPNLNKINLGMVPQSEYDQGLMGSFNNRTNTLSLPPDLKQAQSTMLHELQHGIQNSENFGTGGGSTAIKEALKSEILLEQMRASRRAMEMRKQIMDRMFDTNYADPEQLSKFREFQAENERQIASEQGRIPALKQRFEELNPTGRWGSLKDYELYRRLAGETEARNVQNRMQMDLDERRASFPGTTQEYPNEEQYVRMRGERADGGEVESAMDVVRSLPTEQSRRRATLEQLGSFEDRPVMDPATMGQNWANAVRRFRERPLREGEATVRPLELGGRDVLGGAIAGDGGIVRSRIADIVAGSRGLPGSGTLGFGLADFTPAGVPLAVSDFSDAVRNEDYLSAGLTAALPAAYFARKPIMAAGRAVYDAGARAVDTARDVLGRVPAPVAAGGAGAAVMTPEEAEAGKADIVRRGLEAVTRTNPPPLPRSMTLDEVRRTFDPQAGVGMSPREIDLLTDAYGKVASPAMMNPELAQRGQEIAQGYITKRGSEFGGRSFFNQEPSVPLEELGRATTSIPVSSELRPIVEKSWQEVARERQGSPVITLGGDLSDWNRIVGYGPQDNLYALSRPSDIHAGFDYMREPNPYTIWANNLEHAAVLDKKVQQQKDILRAVDKDLPIMATAAPMGPQSIDSAKNMMDMLLSAIDGRGIHPEYLKDATKYLKSGAFGNTRKAKEAYKKKMEGFPGFENPEEARQFLLNNPEIAGTVRGDIVKGLERKGWVKKGFPEIGQLRYAASSPQFGLAAGNLMGGRMVEIDPALFGRAMKDKMFSHMTYPGDTFGRYYADVPLVHRQYGAPDAMDELMVKYNQWRPGAKKSDPPKPPITVHPFSLQQSGRDTVRKMFEEQRMVQRINERMLESIERGEQRRPLYGFRDGGNVANHAINLAREINSSPREETVP